VPHACDQFTDMLLAPTSQRLYVKLPSRDSPQTQKLICGTEFKAALPEQECERALPQSRCAQL